MKTLVYLLLMLLSSAISETPEEDQKTRAESSCNKQAVSCSSLSGDTTVVYCKTETRSCLRSEDVS